MRGFLKIVNGTWVTGETRPQLENPQVNSSRKFHSD